jgi:predicted transcriptional regulator
MSNVSIKDEARRIVEGLPPNATWEDLHYEIFVRQKIEAGLADATAGRTVSQAEVRRQFGQQPS